MKERLLSYLACPDCGGDLGLTAKLQTGTEIMEGSLICRGCQKSYAIRGGVPRFATDVAALEQRTADAFGWEWNRYSELATRYRQQFLDWLAPVDEAFFKGKVVLEGGCGKGRHSALSAQFGARDVVSLDLSDAVDAAFVNTKDLDNVHIVQADLANPPVKQVFDFAFSIGVLHHIPHPEKGFRALVSKVKPGGAMAAWVYGREGNGWIVHGVTPVREHVTSHLPHALLDALSGMITLPLWIGTKLIYGPTKGKLGPVRLPYGEYLAYIAPFPFKEQRTIVFDHLVAPVAFYIPREEFEGWFMRAGMEGVQLAHHNGNSWRGFGRVPVRAS